MARKPSTTKVNQDIEDALVEGLDFDFDLDIESDVNASPAQSTADLEAQISRATDELVEAEKNVKAAKDKKPSAEPVAAAPARAKSTTTPPRPLTEDKTSAVSGLSPANDPEGSSRARIMQILEKKAPNTPYWFAGAASIAWLAGSAYVAQRFYGEQIFTLEGISAQPNAMAVIAGATIPVALFFALAALVRREQEMRIATRSMAEVALQLTEPEVKAQNRIMTVSQAIRREVASLDEGIERTLDRAVDLESRVHTEVHELERSYSNNEERIRLLLDNLSREREAVVEHAERVRESLSGVHDALRGQLDGASTTMRDNITAASREISTNLHDITGDLLGRITDQSGQFRSLFDQTAGEFTSKMHETGVTFTKLLDERTEFAVSALDDATQKVGMNVESQIDGLRERLAASGQDLIAEFETRTHSTEESAARLTAALDARTQQLDDTLRERTQLLASSLTGAKSDIEATIDNGRAVLRSEIDEFSSRAATLVDEQTARVSETLRGNTDALAEAFGTGQMAMEMAFAQNQSGFAEALDGMVAKAYGEFDQRASMLVSKMDDVRGETTLNLASNIDRLDAMFNAHRDAVEGRASRMESTLETTTTALDESARNQASILREALQASAQGMNEAFSQHRNGLDNQTAQLATNLAQAGEALEMVINRQNSTLDERGRAMQDMLNATNQTLISAFETQNETVKERAATVTADIQSATQSLQMALDNQAGTMDERTRRLEAEIARAADALNAALDNQAQAIDQRANQLTNGIGQATAALNNAFENQTSQIAKHAQRLEQTLDNIVGELTGHTMRLQDEVGRATGTLNAAFEAQSGIIEERTGTMQSALEKGVGNIKSTLENAAVSVADKLRISVKDAAQSLTSEAKRAEEEMGQSGQAFTERLDGVIAHANEALSGQARQIEATLSDAEAATERLKQRAEEGASALSDSVEGLEGRVARTVVVASERLSEKGQEIATNLQAINARIEDQTNQAAERLQNAAAAAAERMKTENAALVSALTARTEQSIQALTETENALGAGVTDLLDRLTSSNAKLGSLIDMAQQNLGDVDQRLAITTEKFSEETQNTVARLASSIHLVDNNVGRLSDLSQSTLAEVASIANRFDEHGRVLSAATELLSTAQNNLTGTLEERKEALDRLAMGLVDKSAEIEQSMSGFEQLIQSTLARAEGKTRDTSDNMQSAIVSAIEASTDRFMQASGQLRQSAQEIREDLAITREELERGVLELPEETRKSTGALRRAVSDQINALQELSSIVGNSRSAMSVSMPEDRPAPRQAPQREAAPAASNFSSSLRDPAPRPQVQARPAPLAPEPRLAPAPTANESWVGDLLRRASTDEAPRARPQPAPSRSPLQVTESLNSLSLDIARAIDHNASVDLWDRYARGERDVFTRRLYTLRGQQTFDEIRQKYVSEREFRDAVIRYCEDFEKLLSDVSKTDRTGQKTREYLTSDTGKVYTMLAHASGRLK